MDFTEAIQSGFRNYVNFSGRAFRSEFWYWSLFAFLVGIAAEIIDFSFFGTATVTPFSSLTSLALLLPNLGIAVRRLHDTDRGGWWCQRGTMGANRFGSDPLEGQSLSGVSPRG